MQLGVTRVALSRVLNERAAISPAMALRIEGWLGVARGGRAEGEAGAAGDREGIVGRALRVQVRVVEKRSMP